MNNFKGTEYIWKDLIKSAKVNSLGKLPFAPMWNKEEEIWHEIENLLFQVPLSA